MIGEINMIKYNNLKPDISIYKVECICKHLSKPDKETEEIKAICHKYNCGGSIDEKLLIHRLEIKDISVLYNVVMDGDLTKSILAVIDPIDNPQKYVKFQTSLYELCYYFIKDINITGLKPEEAIYKIVYTSCKEGISNIYIDPTVINNQFGSITGLLSLLPPGIRWLIPTIDSGNNETMPVTTIIVEDQDYIRKDVYR